MSAELRTLRATNEALSKRRRAKKTRIRQGGTLTIEEAQDIIAQKDIDEQVRRNLRIERGNQQEGQLSRRYYSTCSKASYNIRTC